MAINRDLVEEVSPSVRMLKDQVEYHWLVGCTVTAVTMVLGYWDRHGYDNLIEGDSTTYSTDVMEAMASSEHYRDYAEPLDGKDGIIPDASVNGEPHENNCVADFCYTSRSDLGLGFGWSLYAIEGIGVHGYATHRGYDDFVTKHAGWGRFSFQSVANEIDAGRPVILSVDSDADGRNDHNVVCYGYDSANNKLLIHDGWERTDEPRWIDFTYARDGQPFGITSATTIMPGDEAGSDGAIDFLHIQNDWSGTAASYQETLNADGTFSSTKLASNSNLSRNTVGLASADGHTFYQLYDDNSGSVALYRAVAYGDGTFKWFRLSSDSNLGDRTIDFATADGRVFYQLYDDGSGTAALYKSTRHEDGTFTSELLSVDSGMSRNTIGLSTTDGETFYQLVNDGYGSAALYEARLLEDGTFDLTLVNADSNLSRSTIAHVAWQTDALPEPIPDNHYFDDPNQEQYLQGDTNEDVFIIDGNADDYNWAPSDDGTGVIIWNDTGFDMLWDFETIRFNDRDIDLTNPDWANRVEEDDPNQTQYLGGTDGEDIFKINGNSEDYNWAPSDDGTGVLIWNDTGFDMLWDYEIIRFNDRDIDLTDPSWMGRVEEDDPTETQYLGGTDGEDIFKINGNSADYNWAPSDDGTGVLIWNDTGFDMLWDYEIIRFNDRDIDLTDPDWVRVVDVDDPNETQYLSGTEGEDIFKIDGNSEDYNWAPSEDGAGILIWNDTGFDILWDYETIRFNDKDIDLTAPKVGRVIATDNPDEIEFLGGTEGHDIFKVDGKASDYQIAPSDDGAGVMIWNDKSFDILYDFEEVRFTDQTVNIEDQLV